MVVCDDQRERFMVNQSRRLLLLMVILLGAGFWLSWPKNQRAARAVGGTTTEVTAEPKAPATLTFSKDVSPIIFNNCASCHRPGGVAPFSLLSYQDAKKRAQQIASETRMRASSWFDAAAANFNLSRRDAAKRFAEKLLDDEQYRDRARDLIARLSAQ